MVSIIFIERDSSDSNTDVGVRVERVRTGGWTVLIIAFALFEISLGFHWLRKKTIRVTKQFKKLANFWIKIIFFFIEMS